MKMIYRNYRGETSVRHLEEDNLMRARFEEGNQYHGDAAILKMFDADKENFRDFKLADCDFLITQSKALTSVIMERAKQVEKYRFHADHDDDYSGGTLAEMGIAYTRLAIIQERKSISSNDPHFRWPISMRAYRPEPTARENLVKGIALMIAELERMDRAASN